VHTVRLGSSGRQELGVQNKNNNYNNDSRKRIGIL
jgi:hypothetical protein